VIPLELAEVRRLCPGRLEQAPGAVEVTGLEIDSRRIRPGDLFVAVRGGVAFVADALSRGAAAALVPEDDHAAMASLGRAVRDRSSARVVAVTGSTGKTSTKDILAALCRPHRRTVAAEQSHNNEIGLPLTLTRIEADTEVVVAEMGTRGMGQVRELSRIARPEIAVIAQIGPAHLELFGTVERVAEAEAEVVTELPRGGVVCIPVGERLLEPHVHREGIDVVTYGPGGDVELLAFEPDEHDARLEIRVFDERAELTFNVRSRHNATNALAALAAYRALGLPLADAQMGASQISLSRFREEEVGLPGGGLLINDAYNANPVSMAAALDHLAERARGRRRVAVLGDMAELGPNAPVYHGEVGRAAARAGVDVLVALGPLARGYLEGAEGIAVRLWAPTPSEGLPVLREALQPGDCVLVKGSRSMGLETVAEALKSEPTVGLPAASPSSDPAGPAGSEGLAAASPEAAVRAP
jgi:UDP-N-acetylmuramoyl-tripeptide--D-alanyl-D-alanine ligase